MPLYNLPENLTALSKKQIKENKEEVYDKYAQKPSIRDRRYKNLDRNHIYIKFADRNEFLRDRDRIIFSKAFRRLEHKAQVYSHEKGDHFRTRLTHTLEVMQIAKSIGKNLGLNEDLIEAIALGHDIGHTPFGHSEEEVLDGIMRGKDDLGGKLRFNIDFGGFKHNFHSLKILDILERKYKDKKGLNLTWQVMEGILKHTSVRKKKENKEWDLKRFIQYSPLLEQFMIEKNMDFSVTLEGQVVSIADEIAQRQHDLDDGLRDKDLNLRDTEIIDYIQEAIDRSWSRNLAKPLAKMIISLIQKSKDGTLFVNDKGVEDAISKVYDEVNNSDEIRLLKFLKKNIESREEKREFKKEQLMKKIRDLKNYGKVTEFSKDQMDVLDKIQEKIDDLDEEEESSLEHIWISLVRDITEYFILDVTINSLKGISYLENEIRIKKYSKFIRHEIWNEGMCLRNKNIILTKIIDFSPAGKELDKYLEQYINNSILNSYDVNRFDGKAYFIIRQIFKAYYANPRQMPKEFLELLSYRINTNKDTYKCEIKLENEIDNKIEYMSINSIRFKDSPPKDIERLIKLLKLELSKKEIEDIFKNSFKNNLKLDEGFLRDMGFDMNLIKEKCKECNEKNYQKWLFNNIIKIISQKELEDILNEPKIEKRKQLLFLKCLLENHYAYMSIVCDHIAGMTDNYAKNEYERLYLV